MLEFIIIILVLSFLFRRGGLFRGRGLFGGLFGGYPFWMGGGYRHHGPWGHRPPMGPHGMGPHGGMHHHGPMGGPGGPHGRF